MNSRYIEIQLTNPGIISRLDEDITDYLSPFGYRLAYAEESSGNTAVLKIPLLPDDSPMKTLYIHNYDENFISTIGPLIRTYLRLSDTNLHPKKLRAVIDCLFVIKCEDSDVDDTESEKNAAKRMAHHIHMIIRNSMGSALCLDLVIVLPCYSSKNTPLSIQSVKDAMNCNIDACYPCVKLKQYCSVQVLDENCNKSYTSRTLHLNVRTRMCTVRHQPKLFQWLSASDMPLSNITERKSSSELVPTTPQRQTQTAIVCIEKVANLHRILMLCYDYDKHSLDGYGNESGKTHISSLLLLNVVVIMPRSTSKECIDTQQNGNASNCKSKTSKRVKKCLLQYYQEAIDHFHSVVFGSNKHLHKFYQPKLVYEDDSINTITAICSKTQTSAVIGIDINQNALALCGDYKRYKNESKYEQSFTLKQLQSASCIVFGYESTGIPECIQKYLNTWVQIPCRSSINIVASMSIIFDALFG